MTNHTGPHTSGQAHPTEAPEVHAAHKLHGAPAGKSRPTTRPPIHAALAEVFADVALVDGPTAASVGQIGVSQWLDEVREGRAPQPVFRAPRCTRWRLADVREYWRRRAEQGTELKAGQAVVAQATKASKAATEKRRVGGAAAQ